VTAPVWVVELAAWFWDRAGPPPPFPRDLRGAITRSLVGSVISLPGLSVGQVVHWLEKFGIQPPDLHCPDRGLRGALFARAGIGFLFVDADDNPAERRFTLAHELAHLLRDYLHSRERIVAALGPGIVDVLDGWRAPTPAERLHGLLRDIPVTSFTHLMTRDDGQCLVTVNAAERAADRLARELLAPARVVLECVGTNDSVATLAQMLEKSFGLPPTMADYCANELLPRASEDPLITRFRK
jgi:hypothetical protein